jgi:hypothetical protein
VNMRLPIANAVVKMGIAEKAKSSGVRIEHYLVKLMTRSFFFFESNIKCSATHRVYLNVNLCIQGVIFISIPKNNSRRKNSVSPCVRAYVLGYKGPIQEDRA